MAHSHLQGNYFSDLWLPAPLVRSWHHLSEGRCSLPPPALHQLCPPTDWPCNKARQCVIPAEISLGKREGNHSNVRKQNLSNLRNRVKPQGWHLGQRERKRISKMGRSGTESGGKSSFFRLLRYIAYVYNVQLSEPLILACSERIPERCDIERHKDIKKGGIFCLHQPC